jgi:HIV-1 Vpr-binding protein
LQFILCGTLLGDLKMFNVHTGGHEATYQCHESEITHIEMNREG